MLNTEKASPTIQEPNLARNCSSIICFSNSKYANNGHTNLFLQTLRKESCKHIFLKCDTIHDIVVLGGGGRASTGPAVNLLHYLFHLLIHTLEKETTRIRDKKNNSKMVSGCIYMKFNSKFPINTMIMYKIGA